MTTIHRRTFLRLGLGAIAAALADPRRAAASQGPVRSCVLLFMHGGASQIDTWDPKPGRETGGGLKAIRTALPGVRVSEHLPRLARRLRDVAVIRSLTSREGNHDRARYLMHTGYPPQGGALHPSLGSLVAASRERGTLPSYVSIAGPGQGAGLLGAAHAPFVVGDPTKPIRNLTPALGVDDARLARRVELWRGLEDRFAARVASPTVTGHRQVVDQALTMMSSPALEAFALEREAAADRERYGASAFGQGCLLARRLVEVGVPFVEVALKGWDTHEDNFPRVARLGAELDAGMSALLDDLHDRGLLESTLVICIGDFGRTPTINAKGGRDHFPKISAAALAGAGIRGGQVIGATDRDGREISERPVTVPDLFRTVATLVGLDPDETRESATGRPVATVDGGALVDELLA
ncbi:MAG: DUF1501 domain-containing protein [Myxococcales bacterium]|nr:DUF1501 domain-containing protein [Myxococcales bacterium]